MESPKLYALPELPYDYAALTPHLSADLLRLHHDKHHAAYVNAANAILQKMDKARTDNSDFDAKATFKELSFQIGGHVIHSLFCKNLAPEGSGWAALTFCRQTNRPIIMQVEKHNTNVYPMFRILMVLDVWEHAYYLDYRNDRGKFIEACWNIVNWTEVNQRFEKLMKG